MDTGPDAPKKVIHKAGEFIGNKIADAVTKSNNDNIEKQEPVKLFHQKKNNAYVAVKVIISITGTNPNNRINKKLTFKSNAPFRSCISKISNTFIDNAEDLNIFIPLYDLLEYSDNYSMTSGSL